MKFNGKKFQVVRYGKDENLKNETLYFTENTENIVERQEVVRDLGVMMSDDASFKDQIEKESENRMGPENILQQENDVNENTLQDTDSATC